MSKRIMAGIIAGILMLGIAGCSNKSKGDDKTKTEDTSAKVENAADGQGQRTSQKQLDRQNISEIIKTKEDLYKFGRDHIDKFKQVFAKYNVSSNMDTSAEFHPDKRDASFGEIDMVMTNKIEINDGAQNKYENINFNMGTSPETKKGGLELEILVTVPIDRVFKLEEYQMLKDMILAMYDGKYDFKKNDLDKWVNDTIKAEEQGPLGGKYRTNGFFSEHVGVFFDKAGGTMNIGYTISKMEIPVQ
ncbi:hypothetical protein [Clostridium sp. 'White wine YQ']|uniref:hypothetical protein n=1 Tax=Clostridium sp. 'White wine YQ' TaxID=3027474 RepID=UPI0023659D80|nr:hypothetical protein [Clostridium sp. 'White wine YQ']MDD7795199.1 hypothetical protein [Clostridium sp. 'White wine YQ']